MNVVALSSDDGSLLWTKKKVTNNPNAIYVDGRAVLGVGPGGSHLVIDPASGEELEDLKFRKVSCTRLTATPDSFFVRGEGTLRFDRASKKVLIDGGLRPACNDGALPANGMLYIGPWACDFNLASGGVPPAWNESHVALVNFRGGKLTCCDAVKVAERIEKGFPPSPQPGRRPFRTLFEAFQADGAVRWQSDLGEPNKFEVLSLAVCPESVVAAVQYQHRVRAQPQWFLAAFMSDDGAPLWFWRQELPGERRHKLRPLAASQRRV